MSNEHAAIGEILLLRSGPIVGVASLMTIFLEISK
jgi:hypothetical protein